MILCGFIIMNDSFHGRHGHLTELMKILISAALKKSEPSIYYIKTTS